MYKNLTKDCIKDFWDRWHNYVNERLKALLAVCDDAYNYYVNYTISEMYDEDQYYIDSYLNDRRYDIEEFKRRELDKILADTHNFGVFLNHLARLKFEKRYMNYECFIDLYNETWNWKKHKSLDNFTINITGRYFTYDWDNRFQREIKYRAPERLSLTDWIPDEN